MKLEPAPHHIRPQLAGATYTAEGESGDANRFARELVQRCEEDKDASMAHQVSLTDDEYKLFFNTGHGTLGWTHACGSGKSIARIVSGLRPEVDSAFVGGERGPRGVAAQGVSPALQ